MSITLLLYLFIYLLSMSPNPVGSGDSHRTHLDMDLSMKQPSGHRGNLLGVPARSPRGPLINMTSVLFTSESGMSVDLSTSPSKSPIRSVVHHPMKSTGNSSSSYLSTKTTASVGHLGKTSMITGMSGSSSVKRSTDSVVDRPMEHPSRMVPLKVSPIL